MLPAHQRIEALDREVGLTPGMPEAEAGKKLDAFLDRVFTGTKLGERVTRLALLDKSTAELLATEVTR